MIVIQSITADIRVRNLHCFLAILHCNNFYDYKTFTVSSLKPRISFKNPLSPTWGTHCWSVEEGSENLTCFITSMDLQFMTPGEPLTHNMLTAASPASPLSHPSQQILSLVSPSLANIPGISGTKDSKIWHPNLWISHSNRFNFSNINKKINVQSNNTEMTVHILLFILFWKK